MRFGHRGLDACPQRNNGTAPRNWASIFSAAAPINNAAVRLLFQRTRQQPNSRCSYPCRPESPTGRRQTPRSPSASRRHWWLSNRYTRRLRSARRTNSSRCSTPGNVITAARICACVAPARLAIAAAAMVFSRLCTPRKGTSEAVITAVAVQHDLAAVEARPGRDLARRAEPHHGSTTAPRVALADGIVGIQHREIVRASDSRTAAPSPRRSVPACSAGPDDRA